MKLEVREGDSLEGSAYTHKYNLHILRLKGLVLLLKGLYTHFQMTHYFKSTIASITNHILIRVK